MSFDRAASDARRVAIKAALADPRDVARRLGLRIISSQGGRGVSVLHPTHEKRGGSLSLTVGHDGTLRVKCFACGLSGDVLSLVADLNGHGSVNGETFRIASDLAMALPPLPVHERHVDAPAISDDVFAAIIERLLRLAPLRGDVATYLRTRGILREAHADGWGALPWPSEQGRLVSRLLDAFPRSDLLGSGLVCEADPERSHAPHGLRFVQPGARTLIPWRGFDGAVVALQRRRLDAKAPKYVFTRARPGAAPYGANKLGAGPRRVAIVEGAVDVLALRVLAARNRYACEVVGVPGIGGWRSEWAPLVAPKGSEAWVALDNEPDVTAEERATLLARGQRPTRDVVEDRASKIAAEIVACGSRARRWRPRAHDWADELLRQEATRT